MWILAEAPRGSNYYETQSQTGNKVLISDSCDTVIFARMQGSDGHQVVAQRGKEIFLIGPAPERGVVGDMSAQMQSIAKQLSAVSLG